MICQVFILLCIALTAFGFQPSIARTRVSNVKLSMALQGPAKDLVGSDIEYPEFDLNIFIIYLIQYSVKVINHFKHYNKLLLNVHLLQFKFY